MENEELVKKLSNKLQRSFQMILLFALVVLPEDYSFCLRQYIAFCARLSFCFHTSFKIVKDLMMMTNETTRFVRTLSSTQPEGYLEYLSKFDFSEKYVFCVNSVVNKDNVEIWMWSTH